MNNFGDHIAAIPTITLPVAKSLLDKNYELMVEHAFKYIFNGGYSANHIIKKLPDVQTEQLTMMEEMKSRLFVVHRNGIWTAISFNNIMQILIASLNKIYDDMQIYLYHAANDVYAPIDNVQLSIKEQAAFDGWHDYYRHRTHQHALYRALRRALPFSAALIN